MRFGYKVVVPQSTETNPARLVIQDKLVGCLLQEFHEIEEDAPRLLPGLGAPLTPSSPSP